MPLATSRVRGTPALQSSLRHCLTQNGKDISMNQQQADLTPAALYARVSSDRQDVDLSVAAQPRALREYAERNGYSVAREYVDEAESGCIADRPQLRKMIDEGSKATAVLQVIFAPRFIQDL